MSISDFIVKIIGDGWNKKEIIEEQPKYAKYALSNEAYLKLIAGILENTLSNNNCKIGWYMKELKEQQVPFKDFSPNEISELADLTKKRIKEIIEDIEGVEEYGIFASAVFYVTLSSKLLYKEKIFICIHFEDLEDIVVALGRRIFFFGSNEKIEIIHEEWNPWTDTVYMMMLKSFLENYLGKKS